MRIVLLLLSILFPFLSYGQWSESFETSKDTALYDCWTFREAQIVDYVNGYEGWLHLVQLSTSGGYLETPYMEFSDEGQYVYFIFYTMRNEGKIATLTIEYIDTEGDVVASFETQGEGNGSFGASTAPHGFTGRAKLRVSVSLVDNTGENVGIYIDEFQGHGLTLVCEQATLPVTLISFQAVGDQLQWSTATESNSGRFAIEHSSDGRSFREVGTVQASGFSQGRRDYSWRFAKVGGTQYFRLRMIDRDGTYELSKVVAVEGGETVAFGPFTIGVSEKVLQLSIFDLRGRMVKEYPAPAVFPEVPKGVPLILQLVTDRKARTVKVYYKE